VKHGDINAIAVTMDSFPIFYQTLEAQPSLYEAKLAELLDWCQLVQEYLNAGRVEDAKFFLAQAIAEAQKPVDTYMRVSLP
jgi:hypothetical protein